MECKRKQLWLNQVKQQQKSCWICGLLVLYLLTYSKPDLNHNLGCWDHFGALCIYHCRSTSWMNSIKYAHFRMIFHPWYWNLFFHLMPWVLQTDLCKSFESQTSSSQQLSSLRVREIFYTFTRDIQSNHNWQKMFSVHELIECVALRLRSFPMNKNYLLCIKLWEILLLVMCYVNKYASSEEQKVSAMWPARHVLLMDGLPFLAADYIGSFSTFFTKHIYIIY